MISRCCAIERSGPPGNVDDGAEACCDQLVADRVHQVDDQRFPVASAIAEVEADVGGDVVVARMPRARLHLRRSPLEAHDVLVRCAARPRAPRPRTRAAGAPRRARRASPLSSASSSPSEWLSGLRTCGDDEGAVAAALDQPARLEHPERLAHRGAADPVRLRQLALGRQRRARPAAPSPIWAAQPLGDELVHLPTFDRAKPRSRWSDTMSVRHELTRPRARPGRRRTGRSARRGRRRRRRGRSPAAPPGPRRLRQPVRDLARLAGSSRS